MKTLKTIFALTALCLLSGCTHAAWATAEENLRIPGFFGLAPAHMVAWAGKIATADRTSSEGDGGETMAQLIREQAALNAANAAKP